MTLSLYDLSVPTFLQTLRAMSGVMGRAVRHCALTGADPDDYAWARLAVDMAPFHFQIEAMRNHSVWGMEALRTGVFAPPPLADPMPFHDLRRMVNEAVTTLEALTPDEVDGWAGKELTIEIFRPVDPENAHRSAWAGQMLDLTSETYLLTYAFPNFYFHAVTAYDILRLRGVPIGKGDFEGRLRTRSG